MNLINIKEIKYTQLTGGTSSNIYLLSNIKNESKYIVKFNDPRVLESEAYFLNFYNKVYILPDLLFAEKTFKYIVYPFIPGSTNYVKKNKKELLISLVEQLINNYESYPNTPGWGWTDDLRNSWSDFLMSRMTESYQILDSYLDKPDHTLIFSIINNQITFQGEPYILHGDCGIHNFIFNNGDLRGIIDPTPVFGDPLYDLIYAFCSSPDNLTKETISVAVSHLKNLQNNDSHTLYKNVLVGLYFRLATCIRHHPNDLDEYLIAWNYWTSLVKST
ncbi:phosphotransferase [Bacillus sp. AFS088145]|uniref:phosphotransferase n=1 Tax=Bacillus sp. AFS088145 TaxID=2033514 RepID=UPI000BF5B994|nr:phosphotransferase [Bacillus sp. AFS088145]PFH82873.1 aminoglycoside phosphotransferase [Bacillus sp. AFS088145]